MLEQADTAFAQAIQQNDTENRNGAAKRDSPTPPTDPSSKKGKLKFPSDTSLVSMIAQPGEDQQADTYTASESSEQSNTESTPFPFSPRTAEEMYHRGLAEQTARRNAMDVAKQKKKELRASQGRWPRLGSIFGSKGKSPVEEG